MFVKQKITDSLLIHENDYMNNGVHLYVQFKVRLYQTYLPPSSYEKNISKSAGFNKIQLKIEILNDFQRQRDLLLILLTWLLTCCQNLFYYVKNVPNNEKIFKEIDVCYLKCYEGQQT